MSAHKGGFHQSQFREIQDCCRCPDDFALILKSRVNSSHISETGACIRQQDFMPQIFLDLYCLPGGDVPFVQSLTKSIFHIRDVLIAPPLDKMAGFVVSVKILVA